VKLDGKLAKSLCPDIIFSLLDLSHCTNISGSFCFLSSTHFIPSFFKNSSLSLKERLRLSTFCKLSIAEIHDEENPADEDSFYVVSLAGTIGFCEDGEQIDWLFLSGSGADGDLPATYQADLQIKFCPKCGSAVVLGASFCGACGAKLNQA
jgi:hypothetical protein